MSRENAIVLSRISDAKQEDGYSLDVQERLGLEYSQKKGFHILETFRFVETGSKVNKRNKFDAMMDFIKAQIAKQKSGIALHLIVEKPDRLTRNFTNKEQLQFFVLTGGLQIHYYKDRRIVDKNCSPADVFTDDMMTSVSKYIALNIAREVKKGLLEKARNGWYPAHPPAGYKYTRDGVVGKHGRKEARIIVDPELKPIVYRVFELRAMHKKSYEAISAMVREEFQHARDKKNKFVRTSVEYILLNPFYRGRYFWAGEEFEGKHELFIPPSWIEIAQGKMRGTPKNMHPLGAFSYLLTCAVPGCGCQIIYDPKKKKIRSSGEEREYHYYHCTDGKKVHRSLGLRQANISEAELWEQFKTAVQEITLTDDLANEVATRIDELSFNEAERAKQQYMANKERLELLLRKQDQLYDDYTKQLIDEDDFRRLKAKTKDEIHLLKNTLENDYQSAQQLVRERLKFTLELAKGAESNWNLATPSDRIVLLKNVLSNFSLDGLNVRYDLKKVFRILAEIKIKGVSEKWCLGPELNRHDRLTESQDFKSCASTNFATEARSRNEVPSFDDEASHRQS